jgi:dipeptidyl aminopeptidase/acylaminoacyl peptidase
MGGEIDWNVPIPGREQMYQALKSLGRPTELVVYPLNATNSKRRPTSKAVSSAA